MILYLVLILNLGSLFLIWQLYRRAASGVPTQIAKLPTFIIDTSSLIDGRLYKVVHTGFMHGRLLIAEFVLAELQHIADSSDELRRSRGRDGLETVRRLQAIHDIEVKIVGDEAPDVEAVDDKLVAVALKARAAIITNDYNLNRVATIKGVKVLNVNELAQALRPSILPGEKIRLKLVQPGSESHQAVGYLEDGTMVVVEKSRSLINQEVDAEVTNIMQTQAGRMMFARLLNSKPSQ